MHRPAAVRAILARLERQHPDADTELHHRNAYELLVATILSAQSTDERVNLVTPALFERYPGVRELAAATAGELEPLIHATGFYRQKAKALLGMATKLVEEYQARVPADMEALIALPGVGRKTANVVLGHALGVPGLPVDRHVLRVSNRIGLAEGDDPELVEQQLCAALPPNQWTRASDTMILHGRRICRPKPRCPECAVREDCEYFQALASDAGAGRLKPAPTSERRGKSSSTAGARRRTNEVTGLSRPKPDVPKTSTVIKVGGAREPAASRRPAPTRTRSTPRKK